MIFLVLLLNRICLVPVGSSLIGWMRSLRAGEIAGNGNLRLMRMADGGISCEVKHPHIDKCHYGRELPG